MNEITFCPVLFGVASPRKMDSNLVFFATAESSVISLGKESKLSVSSLKGKVYPKMKIQSVFTR